VSFAHGERMFLASTDTQFKRKPVILIYNLSEDLKTRTCKGNVVH